MNKRQYIFLLFITCVLAYVAFTFTSCANRGVGPQGGPKDSIPPVILKEIPENGSVNYKGKTVEIHLNEYVQMNNVAANVLISPPQQRPPEVKGVGKKVTVTFDEDLRDSTTYTIDFGEAICDNNEKNPIKGYLFAFSTGPEIDTLQIGGKLIDARTHNPVSDVYIGIHKNIADSAFEKEVFTRIAKTDENGEWSIHNIHEGQYRVYALNDMSKDYRYQPGEELAFLDTLVTPWVRSGSAANIPADQSDFRGEMFADSLMLDSLSMDSTMVDSMMLMMVDSMVVDSLTIDSITMDSLAKDSLAIDSITKPKYEVTYGPSDLLLMYFSENKQKHVLSKVLREEQHYITLLFSAPQELLPQIRAIQTAFDGEVPASQSAFVSDITADSVVVDSIAIDTIAIDTMSIDTTMAVVMDTITHEPSWMDYVAIVPSHQMDTITLWLTDSSVIQMDTLGMLVTYMKSDSLMNLVLQTDTVWANYRPKKLTKQAQEALDKKKAEPKVLDIKSNMKPSFDVFEDILLTAATPIDSFKLDSLHFSVMVDTIGQPLRIPIERDSLSASRLRIHYDWQPEMTYELKIDSGAIYDIYGTTNNAQKMQMKVRSLDEYSTLILKIEPYDSTVVIEILDEKDAVVKMLPAKEEGTRFEYLQPKDYYVRVFIDKDGNGEWTTGDWQTKRQPEPVYYYPNKLTLRANWEFEETIDYLAKPLLEQKPEALKAKGNDKKKK